MQPRHVFGTLVLGVGWLLWSVVGPSGTPPARTISWGEFVVQSGTILEEDLVQFGGRVLVEPGAEVRGRVYVFQGTFILQGRVRGDMAVLGGRVTIGPTGQVTGTLTHYGGRLQVAAGARVGNLQQPPGLNRNADRYSALERLLNAVWQGLQILVKGLALGVLGFVLGLKGQPYLERTRRVLEAQPVLAWAVGVSGLLLLFLLAVFLFVTVVGAFLAIGIALFLQIMTYAAYLVLGYGLAAVLGQRWPQPWPLPVWVALGTTLTVWGLDLVGALGCLGWMVKWSFVAAGVGALWLSRFGTLQPLSADRALPTADR